LVTAIPPPLYQGTAPHPHFTLSLHDALPICSAEGDLAEAKGVLQALQTELPRLTGEMPRAAVLETARRAAWEAILLDLQAQVPKEVPNLVARIYVALLASRPDAPYSAALAALCPDPPRKQDCLRTAEQLAKEYGIPP